MVNELAWFINTGRVQLNPLPSLSISSSSTTSTVVAHCVNLGGSTLVDLGQLWLVVFNTQMLLWGTSSSSISSTCTDHLFSADPDSPASSCQCNTGCACCNECLHTNLAVSPQKEWEWGPCWLVYYCVWAPALYRTYVWIPYRLLRQIGRCLPHQNNGSQQYYCIVLAMMCQR